MENNKGLISNQAQFDLKPVTIGQDDVEVDQIITHDQSNRTLAFLLAQMSGRDTPTATGVLYNASEPTYEQVVTEQVSKITACAKQRPESNRTNINDVMRQGFNWQV